MSTEQQQHHEPQDTSSDGIHVLVDQVIAHLQQDLKINFVAFDFDHTILSIHTGGHWGGSVKELCQHVRPSVAALLPRLVARPDMYCAIVTFSSQPAMVRSVVDFILSKNKKKKAVLLPIRAEDGSWKTPSAVSSREEEWWKEDEFGLDTDDLEGKQPHMVSAVEELEFLVPGLEIHKASTVLIDDDKNNIRIARDNGVRAVWLDPKNPQQLLADLKQLK
ncbi:expressed unknown protein [Seminavis robusta]|uniref:Uncharacterized protein n=1 Tax=Seminavis robusta TaxID=568900 RepID=A0A9N8EQA4_9STRA|nr:expressed unknown protein [Seminavis robusta]|eukprot:Sro1655_g288980.1 n/a (220) ;mRNA; f:13337-13996